MPAAGFQVKDVILEYTGTLNAGKYISLVDSTINNNNPCTGSYAAATADSLHSGPLRDTGNKKQVTIPQAGVNLLDGTVTFKVCYATGDGSGTDNSWDDSG